MIIFLKNFFCYDDAKHAQRLDLCKVVNLGPISYNNPIGPSLDAI